jgi:hypothetical protein
MADPEWFENIPSELKEAPYFKPQEDGTPRQLEQVVADLSNAAKLQGNLAESHIKIPSPEAAQEDIDSFRERVLQADPNLIRKPDDHSPVPENADGYKDPEGFELDTTQAKALAEKGKWTQAQYEGFVESMANESKATKDGQAQWLADQGAAISEALGSAKDDHLARTVAALSESAPEVAQAITDGTMDAKTVLAIDKLVHQIMDMGGEQGQFNEQAGAGSRVPTPLEAQTKCTEIRGQMAEMRMSDPQYPLLQAKLLDYQRLARPH